jgi:predicted NBD/HSP70 family sugar kinase
MPMQDLDSATLEVEQEASEPLLFKPRGSNQGGMRQYNERVLLQAIRLHGSRPKAELARLTHLSTQTVSLIVDRLLDEGLLQKQDAVRGKVGQPSVPIALNPQGAYSIGIKVGRRSADTLLLDFTGQVVARSSLAYDFPDPPALLHYLSDQLQAIPAQLGKQATKRITGIGVAAPLSMGGWQTLLGVSAERAAAWQDFDLQQSLAEHTDIPVLFIKDTAAACVAELVAGLGQSTKSFVYIFIDTFVGGGIVLDSQWRSGLTGNAGAIGSMVTQRAQAHERPPEQALSTASLHQLEQRLIAAGLDGNACYSDAVLEADYLPHAQAWMQDTAATLALIAHNSACLLDMEAVIVDGNMGRCMLAQLQAALREHLGRYSWEGVNAPLLLQGTIGADARAFGAGLLPLYSSFAPDPEVFLKLDR